MSYTVLLIRRFSQPMKALFELFRRFDARRIFGFIRRLGGMSRPKVECYDLRSTHALRVEGDSLQNAGRSRSNHNFYPRPPGGGRQSTKFPRRRRRRFLSTPSGWRATPKPALRWISAWIFLSTPSGWRATYIVCGCSALPVFLSTPSGWRATIQLQVNAVFDPRISIHALRVEGDQRDTPKQKTSGDFYPRPPGGGRPRHRTRQKAEAQISIHALRVEGDAPCSAAYRRWKIFLSTPSGWRATIPRPRKGDIRRFLSTPSGWRATANAVENGKYYVAFLSTPSGWRATSSQQRSVQTATNFYPRPPGGGRHRCSR